MPAATSILGPHNQQLRLHPDVCPWCEQAITHEKFDEITERIALAEDARVAELEDKLRDQFDRERSDFTRQAEALINDAKRSAAQDIADKLAEQESKYKVEIEGLVSRVEAVNAAKLRLAVHEADLRITTAEAARAETERLAAERLVDFEAQRAALGERLSAVTLAHEAEILERTNDIRETLNRQMAKALLDVKAEAFAEKQKLTEAVDDLKRKLEKKTAAELGEGAEIDLFESLKAAFRDDHVRRVPKGENGADVIHDVVANGNICGRIVYDSKNRNGWQSNFVTKLHADMIAAHADHCILSTNKFPAGAQQLEVCDGVIIANPARVVAVVELLRAHIVQLHSMRASEEQREEKTAAVYEYIISDRYGRLMESLQTSNRKLEALELDERKAHDAMWNKRGRLLNELGQTRDTLVQEVHRIVGNNDTAADLELQAPPEPEARKVAWGRPGAFARD
jgi:hypothetical protein